MVTRRGPVLKKLRHYLAQTPPENPMPHKKLNSQARAVLDTRLRDGLTATLEDVQQRLLRSWLAMRRRAGDL